MSVAKFGTLADNIPTKPTTSQCVFRAFDLMDEMRNMGFFISGLTNLIETLNVIREDVRYILIQRGLMV